MAVRYDQKTKDEVVAFIQNYNTENGRGGQSAAAEKYKISPITIANWLKKAGVKKGRKAKAKDKAPSTSARKGGRPRKAKAKAASSSSVTDVLQRMAAIQGEIDALQAEFDELKGRL